MGLRDHFRVAAASPLDRQSLWSAGDPGSEPGHLDTYDRVRWSRATEAGLPSESILGFEMGNEADIYSRASWWNTTAGGRGSPSLPKRMTAHSYASSYREYAKELIRMDSGVPLFGPALFDPAAHVRWISDLLAGPPRACFIADGIARHADFFSFGTNDLTQTAIGFSRDDVKGRIIPAYVAARILDSPPFATIDLPGVGELVRTAVRLGRSGRANLGFGICGEHGGDPASIRFLHAIGLDCVRCSPFRLPIARVAAAQAAIAAPVR